MYTQTFTDLWAIHTTATWRKENSYPYHFLVQHGGGTAHTAFVTQAGFDRWLAECGLMLGDNIDTEGAWVKIVGTYHKTSYLDDAVEFYAQSGELTRVLSNGDYTLGIITTDEQGIKTVHYLNPNVRSRPVFDYQVSNALFK